MLETTRTAPGYRLYSHAGPVPAKPGMIRDLAFACAGITLELWALPAQAFGPFVAAIPSPLGIGKIELSDGRQVSGFLCEAYALTGAEEITCFGGWRNWRAQIT